MLKVAVSFISGVAFCGLAIIGTRAVLPTQADTENVTETENITQGLLNLLPDFEKIYRDALTMPFKKAEAKIYDEDIARFYRELMDETGLAPSGGGR